MKINKGDFIEFDYTAKTVDDNVVFDTTIVQVAKDIGMIHDHKNDHDHGHEHNHLHAEDLKPAIICVGEKHVLPGLDLKLEGLELGKHKIQLNEEEAFGKKDTKLLKLMPIALFNKQQIRPFVGLALDVDGSRGVVRSISGGRVIVDFNHPLAGKKIEYDVDVKRIVTDHKEQLESVLKMLKFPFTAVQIKDGKAVIDTKVTLPNEVREAIEKDLKRILTIDVVIVCEEAKDKNDDKKESLEKKENAKDKKDM